MYHIYFKKNGQGTNTASYRLQVNVIGPAYLTFLLLPIVRRTAAKYTATVPRITIVSSGAHGITSFDEEALGALDSESLLKKINEPEYSQRIFPDIIGDSLGGSKTMMERRYPDVKCKLSNRRTDRNGVANPSCP